MKLKQQIELTVEEAEKILSKVVENKAKKKVTKYSVVERTSAGGTKAEKVYVFELEDGIVDEQPQK